MAAKTKKNQIPRKSKASKLAEAKQIGDEIVDWSVISEEDMKMMVVHSFRHYGYFYDYKDAYKWVLEYVKKNYPKEDHQAYKKSSPIWTSVTMGAIVRMLTYGAPAAMVNKGYLDMKIRENIHRAKDIKEEPRVERSVKSPADILKEKLSDFIGEIEEVVDASSQNSSDIDWKGYSVYDVMTKKDFAYNIAKGVYDYYKPIRDEFRELKKKKDVDLVEAYSNLPVRKRNEMLKFFEEIVSDAEQYMHNKKAARKPRAKKKPSVERQVAGLKFMSEYGDLKLQSINPLSIVGASDVVLYNTKYKRMIWLTSRSRDGFTVKGTTIQDVDETSSFEKTIRKPEELFGQIVKTTKARTKKLIKELKTKEGVPTGRVNKDVIVYKAYK